MARPDVDEDEKKDRRKKAEEEKEEEVEEVAEELRVTQLAGNAFAAAAREETGLGVDAFQDRDQKGIRGNPDEGDPEDLPATDLPESELVAPEMFGDAGWLPPNPPVGRWWGDRPREGGVSLERRLDRFSKMQAHAGEPQAGTDAWIVPTGELVEHHLLPWGKAVAGWLDDSPLGQVLSWWLLTGASPIASGSQEHRELATACLASLALAAVPALPEASPTGLAVRLSLQAQSPRLDALEHRLASGPPALHRCEALLHPSLSDEATAPFDPAPGEVAGTWWTATLALRHGRTWRPPPPPTLVAAPDDAVIRLLGRGPDEADRSRREQLAALGIGVFRELLRQRIRAAGALAAIADATSPITGPSQHAMLRAVARRVDAGTAQQLEQVQRLGRGLHRPPWLSDADACALIERLTWSTERLRQQLVADLASLTVLGTGEDLPAPPVPSPRPITGALQAGRPDRARRALRDASSLADRAAQALIPPLEPPRLRQLLDEALSEGRSDLAGLLLVPLLAQRLRPDDALALCDAGLRFGTERGNAAILCHCAAAAAGRRTQLGEDPEPTLIRAGAQILALGEGVWADRLAGLGPTA